MFTFHFCVFISVTYALAVTIFTSVLSALAANSISLYHSFVWCSNWYITYHWIKKLICGLSYSTTARWNLWTQSFLCCSENNILSNVAHNSFCSPPFQIGIYTIWIWLWPTVHAWRLNNHDVLSKMSPCKSLSLIVKGTCNWPKEPCIVCIPHLAVCWKENSWWSCWIMFSHLAWSVFYSPPPIPVRLPGLWGIRMDSGGFQA